MIFARARYGKDNYVYLVGEVADAVLVDPGDPAVATALCRAHGVRPRAILHTHGHADHSGGSAALREELSAPVWGHGADAAWFAPDEDLEGEEEVVVGRLRLRVHHVPGHTPGSVLFAWRGRLLTGDTLFWGGCGNCRHGGDPAMLARSFTRVIAKLEGGLHVHPGHDYAAQNLPFAIELEPDNAAARAQLDAARRARAAGQEPEPTTLVAERAANPFLRLDAMATALAARGLPHATPEESFVSLRLLRDRFQG